MTELIAVAKPKPFDIVVVGCSSSEAGGHKIGTDSSEEIAAAIFAGIYPVLREQNLYLAAQCCEQYRLEPVNVMPQPKAGGSFATTAYRTFTDPVAVEEVQAVCGLDIGGTLIGMHLKKVAVPVRLSIDKIGEARLLCARTRPKFIGGCRAVYNQELL